MEQLQLMNGAYNFQHACKPKGDTLSINYATEQLSSSIYNISTCLKLEYDESSVVFFMKFASISKVCFYKV